MSQNTIDCFASCAKSTEDLLQSELHTLGIHHTKLHVAGVSFVTTREKLYEACFSSRIANQIYLKLDERKIEDADELYQVLYEIPWHSLFAVDKTFKVEVTGKHRAFNNMQYAAQKAKDAVADKFRNECEARPNINLESPEIIISLHFHRGSVSVYLSATGESLHRRGYRVEQGRAPLKETLAAAIVYRSGWQTLLIENSHPVLIDPMCGSGTLLIEAAMIAYGVLPNIHRENFSFIHWLDYDQALFESVKRNALDMIEKNSHQFSEQGKKDIHIIGYDSDPYVIDKAKENIAAIGLENKISIAVQDISKLDRYDLSDLPDDAQGIILTNPPYGERLYHQQENKLKALFNTFSDQILSYFQGWKLCVFSGFKETTKSLSLRSYKQNKLFNGAIETVLYHINIDPQSKMCFESATEKEKRHIEQAINEDDKHLSFKNRLNKNVTQLRKWAKQNEIECYRLYDADIPEFSVAVDLYNNHVHVQEYQAEKYVDHSAAGKRLKQILYHIHHTLDIPYKNIHLKTRKKQAGKAQYHKLDAQKTYHVVRENEALFYVNFNDYLDTGLFLDHRKIRQIVAKASKGKALLNLFSYTCTASVHAALAGAKRITNVDMSRTYLDWGKRNFELNKLSLGKKYEFIESDCIGWLKENHQQYDVIFLDPPTFSNSKKMQETLDVQRDHALLIDLAMRSLKENGILYFSNNYRKFTLDENLMKKYDCQNIDKLCLSRDFLRRPNIHHCWEIKYKSS